jgi:hypothetical protein
MIRHGILLTALAASLMSCTTIHYQLTTFAPPQDYAGEKPHVRQHEGVSIEYDLSGMGALMGFLVHNRLDQDIFIDFARSSLIVNDISLPYHQGSSVAQTQVQLPDVPTWATSLSVRPLSATTSGSMMGAVVMIPAGTRVHFQRVEIPLPLLPFEQQALANGTRQFHPAEREAQIGTMYRHRLAFIPQDPGNEPFFVEDAFVIRSNRLVSRAASGPASAA